MKKTVNLLVLSFLLFSLKASAQNKTIVVLGSSTALGNNASPASDSSYVARLKAAYRKNMQDGVDTIIQLLAHTGYNTYNAMPDDYVLPPNRTYITIDPQRNITKTLTYSPNIVIINLPSNDPRITPDYNMKETMDNFRLMYQMVVATGAKCFITTPQPRNDFNPPLRQQLRQLVDSVINNFGVYALNFWDDIVTKDGLYSISPEVVSEGSSIHLNNHGHRLLFNRVMAKNIFNPEDVTLPVVLTDFNAQLDDQKVNIKWSVEQEEPTTLYEIQRSANGYDFSTIYSKKGEAGANQKMNYYWTDPSPLIKKNNFYRLKIIEAERVRYSQIVRINNKYNALTINKVYLNHNVLIIEITAFQKQQVSITIMNQSGQSIKNKNHSLTEENNKIYMPLANISSGIFVLRINTAEGETYIQRFLKP